MASLKFRHYATESDLKGTGEIQNALNAFDVGTIVFIDDTQKQYIITGKNNNVVTYKIYYGKAAIVGVTGTGATRTLTFSDGSEITITINDVEHATTSDSCSGNAKSATTLQTAHKINGTNFNGSADITTSKWGEFRNIGIVNSDGTGTAVTVSVNGSSNVNLKLPETIKANLDGNASSATKATNDGSGNTITTTYATKTERVNNDITAVSLTASKLTLTRTAGNITANIPTWNQNTTGTAAKATADANGNNIANTYATKAEVAALPKSMVIKGTLDAGHTLPTSGMIEGDTYIVGAKGTYNNIACKVGDFFVRTSDSWLRIPAGDEWEYNENTIKAIKVDNAGHADTAGTATTAGNANTIGGISISKLVYGSNSTKTTDITEDQLNAPLASGFYTISNTTTGSSATIPNATRVSMILHTSYSGPDNNAGFDLLINDSETSSLHFRPATGAGKGAWKTLIDTGNIGLQSVNYAASSGACTGNAATATTANKAGYSEYTLSLNSTVLPSSSSNAANTVWCKFATITFNTSAWCSAAGYIFFSGDESYDYKGILEYHFRSGQTASELSIAQLSWIVKSHDYASVIAVKTANNIYDFYTNNCSAWSTPRIYHFSASSTKFKWNVGSWTTTKPTAAYTASDVGRVYYSTNAGNANTATTAISATNDSNGNNIVNTYARIDKVYSDSSAYRQFLGKGGSSTDWIRTTESGIIPYTSGDSANGHSMLGTPTWYFSQAYIQNIYGYLHGNISGSSTSCSGNSLTATKLQTARTIWGQSFDGSGNITGPIHVKSKSSEWGNYNEGIRLYGSTISDAWSNIQFGCNPNATSGSHTNQWMMGRNGGNHFGIWHGTDSTNAVFFINTSNNVGIGTTSPTSKLHVAGTGYFTSDISSASNIIAGGYIKGETVKISSGCTLQYDSAQKCVKFVF